LRKNISIPNPIDEVNKDYLSGWIEKQDKKRIVATLRAHYRIIHSPENKEIQQLDTYNNTTETDFAEKAKKAVFYKAIYKDIFKSHLTLLTKSLPPTGALLEVVIHFPNYESEIVFLARIESLETKSEMGREVYPARLESLAVNQESLTKLIYDINQKKLKRKAEDELPSPPDYPKGLRPRRPLDL
jgi:hypothetical protein